MRRIVSRVGGRLVTFDDKATRTITQADRLGFLRQFPDGRLAIDEVRRAPRGPLALKFAADEDSRPGRFLLTGSANPGSCSFPRRRAASPAARGAELHTFSPERERAGYRSTVVTTRSWRRDLRRAQQTALF